MKELIEKAIQINEELVARIRELEELEGESAKPDFEKGDWVLITKPKDVIHDPIWPYWSYCMDKYDGQTLEIEEINSDGYLVIDGWKFNSDWCKKVGAQKSFKVGDWFIPEDFYNTSIYWDFKMDKFSGKKLKIEAITTSGMLLSNNWKFHPDWCTKVEAPKPKVGDLCILWDNDKSEAIIGILSSIDISDYPYGVSFISYYKNCIKFESVEQYNEFING